MFNLIESQNKCWMSAFSNDFKILYVESSCKLFILL